MLRLQSATRAAQAPGPRVAVPGRGGLRALICCIALALGWLLVAPASGLANPITDENAQAGSTGWERSQADAPRIEAYTSKTSVAPGEIIGFHVSTNPQASYRVIIYRLGWYGGAGARQMTCIPGCSSSNSGVTNPTPNPNAQTGEIDANWTQSASLTIPSNWTTGEYVAEYVLTSGPQSGLARYSPFVVRSNTPQASASNILVVVPLNSYLAYNNWGGTSAYENNTNKSIFNLDHATKVSFNRPFHRRDWRFWDLPLLRFLEREGYDVSYVSDADVDANPNILLQHRAVLVSGHSEYWTKNMRDGFEAARDAATNIAFMGANDAYWQVRYEDSSCPDDNTVCTSPGPGNRRTMVIYKLHTDPISNPALATTQFRKLGRPECELQGGVQYGSFFPNDGYRDFTTTAAGATDPWASGTGLSSGSTIPALAGFEYDSFFPDCHPPGQPTILFQYQGPETTADIDSAAVRYTDPSSGARVFSSGTEQWSWGLDSYRWDPTLFTGIPPTNAAIQQFTRNMLGDMTDPAPPPEVTASKLAGSINVDTTPRADARITSYKIYRHAGTAAFKPGDPGVTLVCQNASGDCTDTPAHGTYRYASVAVDLWNDSAAALSSSVFDVLPTAVDDSATVGEDANATTIPVLANDSDPDGDPITISSSSQPANGTVALTGGTAGARTGLSYRPDANYCNTPPGTLPDPFTYTVNGDSTAIVSVKVSCLDDAPTAANDSATVTEDAGAVPVPVLANDTDLEGDPITITDIPGDASSGSVLITGGGSGLTYRPDANHCGPDSFSYEVNGGDTAAVSMTVTCVDDPPMGVDDTLAVTEDSAATPIDVLANDTDIDGGPKTIASADQADHGTVAITGGGTGLTYRPDPDYCNTSPPGRSVDDFGYNLNGGDRAAVSVTVTCVEDPPSAKDDTGTVGEDASATAIPVLSNDADVDGDAITISSSTQPANGTVTLTGGTTGARTDLTYRPDANYCNTSSGSTDTFTYTVNGGDTATASMTVTCVDDAPVAVVDTATVAEDSGTTGVNALGNDTDIDGGSKTVNLVTQPAHGKVAINGDRSGLSYRPDADYCGPDSFTYKLSGGSQATVSMTVTCVDDAPDAARDSATVTEDDPATAIDVLANDTDVDDGLIAIAARTQPPHGNVLITGGGSGLTYQPDPGYCNTPPASATDIFTYTLNGGDAATVSAAVICSPVSAPQRETSPATKTKCNRKSKYSKKARKKCRKKRRHGK